MSALETSEVGRVISRRRLLELASKGAAGLWVGPGLLACVGDTPRAMAGEAPAGSASVSCVQTARLTEGPFFFDEKLERSDLRPDPDTGAISAGVPLELAFEVARVATNGCTPLAGAVVDVWHCDAGGEYSGVGGGAGRRFLRGYQVTDDDGGVRFRTVYPGWYSGRAVHVHFKVRIGAGSGRVYDLASQLFFPETMNERVHAERAYTARGPRDVINSRDGIYRSLTTPQQSALTLEATESGSGYAGTVRLGLFMG